MHIYTQTYIPARSLSIESAWMRSIAPANHGNDSIVAPRLEWGCLFECLYAYDDHPLYSLDGMQ